jgi:phosphoglycerate dehydrogenase-like enzyme
MEAKEGKEKIEKKKRLGKEKESESMRPKLLLLDEPHPKAKEIMESVCECVIEGQRITSPIDFIYTQLTKTTATIPVFCPCTGVDHIQAPEIIHLDDEWKCTEGKAITSTAEHTWSLILQLAKLNRMQLSGKTLGVIGSEGRIGSCISKWGRAFDMNVLCHDLKRKHIYTVLGTYCGDRTEREMDKELSQLLQQSDIITLHVPLNNETRCMISKEQFDMMKPGALLVNTSRADIVNIDALYEALYSKKIAGYADDFATGGIETLLNNVIRTPHIAGNCIEAREATDIYIANKIVQYVKERYQ